MKCPSCRYDNPEGMNFCGRCRVKLERNCPHCDFPNPTDFQFCGKCGHDLDIPTQPTTKALSHEEKLDKMLAEIYNWFKEGFDTPDLKEAKEVLEEII